MRRSTKRGYLKLSGPLADSRTSLQASFVPHTPPACVTLCRLLQ